MDNMDIVKNLRKVASKVSELTDMLEDVAIQIEASDLGCKHLNKYEAHRGTNKKGQPWIMEKCPDCQPPMIRFGTPVEGEGTRWNAWQIDKPREQK